MTDTVERLSTSIELGVDIDHESADDFYKSSKRDNEEEMKSVETSLENVIQSFFVLCVIIADAYSIKIIIV